MTACKNLFAGNVLLACLLAEPQNLLACSVCYGAPDSGMAKGLVWGIVTLLGVVAVVLAGIVTFFVHVGKRSASLSESNASGSSIETKG
jgi:hypothetical protein